MPQITLSNNYKIDSLLQGHSWKSNLQEALALTYSFPTEGSTWIDKEQYGFGLGVAHAPNVVTYFSETQQNHFKTALSLFSDVANITFTEVSEPTIQGDIRAAFSTLVATLNGGSSGWAHGPATSFIPNIETQGDVWLNPEQDSSDFTPGKPMFPIILHELGHALGLKHSFSKEEISSSILPTQEESTQYTLMTYTPYKGAGFIKTEGALPYEATPATTLMLYDILALQYLYGANTNTRTGDDVYTFNTQAELKTIWDADGEDTFDLSNQTSPVKVDLNEGTFSSIGITQEAVGSVEASNKSAVDNIAIAFNTVIENAIGGDGNDTLTGTALANKLTGGKGDDVINGGDGDDTALFSGNYADYTVSTKESALLVSNTTDGTDTLNSIEYLQFSDQRIEVATLQTNPSTQTNIPTKVSEVITTPTEGDDNYFFLQLSSALSTDFSVDFTTRDGTASQGSDYVMTSGTATIQAGQLSTVIKVNIIDDSEVESNETFSLVLTNPVGASFSTGVTEMTASRTIIDNDGTALNKNEPILVGIVDETIMV